MWWLRLSAIRSSSRLRITCPRTGGTVLEWGTITKVFVLASIVKALKSLMPPQTFSMRSQFLWCYRSWGGTYWCLDGKHQSVWVYKELFHAWRLCPGISDISGVVSTTWWWNLHRGEAMTNESAPSPFSSGFLFVSPQGRADGYLRWLGFCLWFLEWSATGFKHSRNQMFSA